MTYLRDRLEPGDHYVNHYKRATLPCDTLLDKPDELAALSGPVKVYNVRDSKGEVRRRLRAITIWGLNVLSKLTNKYREYVLVKYENHIRCTRCKQLILVNDNYCTHCREANLSGFYGETFIESKTVTIQVTPEDVKKILNPPS